MEKKEKIIKKRDAAKNLTYKNIFDILIKFNNVSLTPLYINILLYLF